MLSVTGRLLSRTIPLFLIASGMSCGQLYIYWTIARCPGIGLACYTGIGLACSSMTHQGSMDTLGCLLVGQSASQVRLTDAS